MDALLIFAAILIALVALAGLSVAFGTDSREDFADDRVRATLG